MLSPNFYFLTSKHRIQFRQTRSKVETACGCETGSTSRQTHVLQSYICSCSTRYTSILINTFHASATNVPSAVSGLCISILHIPPASLPRPSLASPSPFYTNIATQSEISSFLSFLHFLQVPLRQKTKKKSQGNERLFFLFSPGFLL